MTESVATDSDQATAEWLTAEDHAWLAVVRLLTWLPWSIDRQLQRDSGLAMVEYQVLAMLSECPGHTMRMSRSRTSPTRHCPDFRASSPNSRIEGSSAASPIRPTGDSPTRSSPTTAIEPSYDAAGHVAHVRRLVIDVLSSEQLRRLGRDAERIMARIDASTIT